MASQMSKCGTTLFHHGKTLFHHGKTLFYAVKPRFTIKKNTVLPSWNNCCTKFTHLACHSSVAFPLQVEQWVVYAEVGLVLGHHVGWHKVVGHLLVLLNLVIWPCLLLAYVYKLYLNADAYHKACSTAQK